MNKLAALFFCCLLGMVWHAPAHAIRSFSVALTTPSPAQFEMGTTSPGTFRVTHTGNQDTISRVRFRINNGDYFSNTTTAPAGWTVSFGSAAGGGYRTVTFTATSVANHIAIGAFRDFTIAIIFRRTSADATERLRDVRSTFTSGGGGTSNVTVSNQPSWTLKSLIMTITPSSLSVARSCTGAFTLTMQITNRSTANITGVTSVPKPPTLTVLSGAPAPSATTTSNPANLNLNAGASGTMVWVYNTGPNTGTISFTAYAATSPATRTSRAITSSVITVTSTSCIIADFNATPPSPTCIFSGDTVTFTMRVTNNTGITLSNVTPSALTRGGTATIGAITGPAPASVATMVNGAVQNFTWTAPISGNPFDTYTVAGFVTATGGYVSQTTTTAAADLNGFVLDAAPDATAFSTNQEMTWAITNHGCNTVRSVSIPIPAGWTWNGDSYSLVYTGGGASVETWSAAVVGSNVVFTAPGGSEMAIDDSASSFNLTMTTPSVTSTTNYVFSATVTDTNGTPRVRTITSPLVVNPFNTGAPNPNATEAGPWREVFQ